MNANDWTNFINQRRFATLTHAKALLQRGWVQGVNISYVRGGLNDPCFCINGALVRAMSINGIGNGREAIFKLVMDANPEDRDMVGYNDTPGRTHAECIQYIQNALDALMDTPAPVHMAA
jgi:hypothetical protein